MAKINIEIDEDLFLDVYKHTIESDFNIEFFYGSRDSGKSRHIAQILVKKCLSNPSFKCALIRKVFNTVQESQFEMIKEVVYEWGLNDLFKFTTHPLGIICRNGGRFLARGLDEPKKLKSLTNPTDAWVEEGNDITAADWTIITTSLRATGIKTQILFSFNPDLEEDYEDFWLYREYFSHTEELSFENKFEVILADKTPAEIKYRATHSTFYDNRFCPAERRAIYENLKDPYEYMVYAQGMWGRKKIGGEYLSSFRFKDHVKQFKRPWLPDTAFHVSIDNNVKPYIAISIFQILKVEINNQTVYKVYQVMELPQFEPDNRASRAGKAVADWFKKIGYGGSVFLYGDKSTKSRNTIDDNARSFFQIFNETIQNNGFKTVDKFLNFAPSVVSIGDFVNAVLDGEIPNIQVLFSNICKYAIKDYISTKKDKDGTILKILVKDKNKEGSYQKNGHFTDTFKDFMVQCFYNEFVAYKNRHAKLKPGGIKTIDRTDKFTL